MIAVTDPCQDIRYPIEFTRSGAPSAKNARQTGAPYTQESGEKAMVDGSEALAGMVDAGMDSQDALRRADSKAATLLQLVGAALAGVVALVASKPSDAAVVLLWLALVPILVSVLLLLATILPRLNRDPVPGSWLHAAQVGPGTLLDSYRHGNPTSAAMHVCVVARMARRKYQYLQVAVLLLVVGMLLLVAALAVIA